MLVLDRKPAVAPRTSPAATLDAVVAYKAGMGLAEGPAGWPGAPTWPSWPATRTWTARARG